MSQDILYKNKSSTQKIEQGGTMRRRRWLDILIVLALLAGALRVIATPMQTVYAAGSCTHLALDNNIVPGKICWHGQWTPLIWDGPTNLKGWQPVKIRIPGGYSNPLGYSEVYGWLVPTSTKCGWDWGKGYVCSSTLEWQNRDPKVSPNK
jgi:hypothetical protein